MVEWWYEMVLGPRFQANTSSFKGKNRKMRRKTEARERKRSSWAWIGTHGHAWQVARSCVPYHGLCSPTRADRGGVWLYRSAVFRTLYFGALFGPSVPRGGVWLYRSAVFRTLCFGALFGP